MKLVINIPIEVRDRLTCGVSNRVTFSASYKNDLQILAKVLSYSTPLEKVIEDIEKLRKGIEELIDDYQHEINEMEEDRMREGVSVSNAFLTGKIGAYGKAIADLRELLEGVEE